MTSLYAYLPQDRRRALVQGATLPDRTFGSVLFADISGFTPLTEKLTQALGPRRGAEELTHQINTVYTALIAEIERHGGSVISFAGDAMLCWFGGKTVISNWGIVSSAQVSITNYQLPIINAALPCALAMQTNIQTFPNLALKVAVTTGPARRFVVGDPAIDTLAGLTITRAAIAEHLAQRGEIIIDEATAHAWGTALTIAEWRVDPETQERFAVVEKAEITSEKLSVTDEQFTASTDHFSLITDSLPTDYSLFRPFILPAIYERETSGQSVFLTEFRPGVALFVRFMGIDYEADTAHAQLDAFARLTQTLTVQHGGTFLALVIGDKGSYAYLNWGALSAHEDDVRRAVKTALALRQSLALPLQMGLTQGVMRVGVYGGPTRHTYGALGDEVNLAARLMMTAAAGEIVVSSHVHKVVAQHFATEPRPPLRVKGKAKPLPVFVVTDSGPLRAIRLLEPTYALPMVGRQSEMQTIHEKLDLAATGQGQVIGIMAEAGLGKSRLVAEVIRAARHKGFVGYGGAGQSDGSNTPYLAWKPIWQAFFGINPELPLHKQFHLLASEIEDRAPARAQALPLLNVVLDVNIPENNFTQQLEPKVRQSALHALLEECLQAAAKKAPVLIVMEDLHWIDALTHDLLEQLVKALAHTSVCFVLASRPPQLHQLQISRLTALPQFTQIELAELTISEATQAIHAKLKQLYPAHSSAVPSLLVEKLMARAQGNPFYLEELLNYLHDRGLDPYDPADLGKIELPDGLHTLILSRIDQLSEQEKNTLRVASIIGRLFRTHWLLGYYPTLGPLFQVQAALGELTALDLIALDTPEPEVAHLFKHIVTHEVTYESLPYATRIQLHAQLAQYLENTYAAALPLEVLAFHYGRSDNRAKQREYLRKAGEVAQQNFANAAALNCYNQLLPLLETTAESAELHLKRGQVQQLLGNWAEAEEDYRAALVLAGTAQGARAQAQLALSRLSQQRGEIGPALEWLAQAEAYYTRLADQAGLARVWSEKSSIFWLKGDYATAQTLLTESLSYFRAVDDKRQMADLLGGLGLVAHHQSNYPSARTLYEESLVLHRALGNKSGITITLINLGILMGEQGNEATAQVLLEESLGLYKEMGDKQGVAMALTNLGQLAHGQGDYSQAQRLLAESLALKRLVGGKLGIANSLNHLGDAARDQGDYPTARALYAESLTLGAGKIGLIFAHLGLGLVALPENLPLAREHILHSLREAQGELRLQNLCLIGAAGLAQHQNQPLTAAQLLGAVAKAFKTLSIAMAPVMRRFYTQTLASLQEQLGETAFNAAWAEGEKMTLEEAVQLALQETP